MVQPIRWSFGGRGIIYFLIIFTTSFAYTKASTAIITVVEYQPVLNTSLSRTDRILANIAEYVKIIESINYSNLDMIIFPEDTLRNNPETSVELTINDTPCDDEQHNSFVRDISCAARNSSVYVVINLVTKIKCEKPNKSKNCENFGHFFYNTDAIFDRSGKIINLYHKYNLFGERELDKPPKPEEVVIETDFGVKFGIFICFDILFKSPAQDLLKKDVDAIIFPSMWFSQLPFLTSLQTQEMWARAHNITLFSSGANNPFAGSGGSGIFDGEQGMILAGIEGKGGSHVYTYRYVKGEPAVPFPSQDTDALAKEMEKFRITADPSVKEYNSIVLDVANKDFNGKLCYNGSEENQLCCDFTIKMTTNGPNNGENSYTYHLVAFSGVRSFAGNYNGGIEICGVIACLNSSLSSCGHRFPHYENVEWPITFEELTVKANFEISENKTQYPNSLLSSIRPIQGQTLWEGEEVDVDGKKMVERRFSLKKSQNRLLTFAIFGRNFGQDSSPKYGGNGAAKPKTMGVTWFLAIILITVAIFARK